MIRTSITQVSCVVALALWALFVSYAASSAAPQEAAGAKGKGPRLPNFYARVSTVDQQDKLRAIVQEYAPKIQQKRSELQALITKRDAALDQILTPEQRQQVAKLRDEAAARRKAASDSAGESGDKAKKGNTRQTKDKDAA